MIEKQLLQIGSEPSSCLLKISGTTTSVYFEIESRLHALEATRTGSPRVFLTIDSAVRTVRKLFPKLNDLSISIEHDSTPFKEEVIDVSGPAVRSSPRLVVASQGTR
jgi:hypothetical protein